MITQQTQRCPTSYRIKHRVAAEVELPHPGQLLVSLLQLPYVLGHIRGGLPRTAGALQAQAGQATDTGGTGGTHTNTVVILVTGVTGHASESNKTNIQQ